MPRTQVEGLVHSKIILTKILKWTRATLRETNVRAESFARWNVRASKDSSATTKLSIRIGDVLLPILAQDQVPIDLPMAVIETSDHSTIPLIIPARHVIMRHDLGMDLGIDYADPSSSSADSNVMGTKKLHLGDILLLGPLLVPLSILLAALASPLLLENRCNTPRRVRTKFGYCLLLGNVPWLGWKAHGDSSGRYIKDME